jgi:hypothetical protein
MPDGKKSEKQSRSHRPPHECQASVRWVQRTKYVRASRRSATSATFVMVCRDSSGTRSWRCSLYWSIAVSPFGAR